MQQFMLNFTTIIMVSKIIEINLRIAIVAMATAVIDLTSFEFLPLNSHWISHFNIQTITPIINFDLVQLYMICSKSTQIHRFDNKFPVTNHCFVKSVTGQYILIWQLFSTRFFFKRLSIAKYCRVRIFRTRNTAPFTCACVLTMGVALARMYYTLFSEHTTIRARAANKCC